MHQAASAYRRFLPHYQNQDRTYFITFCSRNRRILSREARSVLLDHIVKNHRVLYRLCVVVVMPDHVHLLLIPIDSALSEIMRRIKGASAREINRMTADAGSIWQREYFDRQMRDSENIRAKGEYIARNPVRAGFVSTPDEYPWLWRSWVEGGEEWR